MKRSLGKIIRESSVLAALRLFVMALVLAACSGPADTEPPDPGPKVCVPGELKREDGNCQPAGLPPDMPCPPGEWQREDGKCQKAGLPDDMPCPPGEWLLEDGVTCQKAGVPPSQCGEGFLPDGKDGCEPILPADPCPEGLMAVPGDTECHEVAPCGSGTWGDIPVEANTEFVDQAYAGGDSDGTQAKPWTTIQKGINVAKAGAVVAVAAGFYPEDVVIKGKPVRLWGRCPAMVEVVGIGVNLAAIIVLKSASGAEVHGVAVTGPGKGIGVSGSSEILVEDVWIHGTKDYGFDVHDDLGLTSVTLRRSLVEQSYEMGVFISGSEVTIDGAVVRLTEPNAEGSLGRGIDAQLGFDSEAKADLRLRGSLIEQNHDVGVLVSGSDATIEATVVRSTSPDAQGFFGRGIAVKDNIDTKQRSIVTVRACLVEKSHNAGVFVGGSDATIESTVVRSTLPDAQGNFGDGIVAVNDPATNARANVTVRASLAEQNHGSAVFVEGSDATIESTVLRATLLEGAGAEGSGISIWDDVDTDERSKVIVRACLVGPTEDVGVYVGGSDATIEASVITSAGFTGIVIEDDGETQTRANVTVHACLVEQSYALGIFITGSDATIESTVVRSTLPDVAGGFGRGIAVQLHLATKQRPNVTVRACLVEQNRDVGIFVSGSDATIESTAVLSTLLDGQGKGGRGINIQDDDDTNGHADVTIRACLIEQSHELGIFVGRSSATIEATTVRSTFSDAQGTGGIGISVEHSNSTEERPSLIIRACLLEQNREMGVFVAASDAMIESTVVRSTLPNGLGNGGRGINIQSDIVTAEQSRATVRGCLLDDNHDVGLFIGESSATVVDSDIQDTARQESDGRFGDGIAVLDGDVTIENVEVTGNARAGVANFGSQVVITDSLIACNGFDLEGDPFNEKAASFAGSTGWRCSAKPPNDCAELGDCHYETSGLEAPTALPPADPLPLPEPPTP